MSLLDRALRLIIAARRARIDHLTGTRILGFRPTRLLPPPTMAGDTALAPGIPRLFARPFVCGPLLVRGLATLAGNLTLLASIHRSESAIFLSHDVPPSRVRCFVPRRVTPAVLPQVLQQRYHEHIDSLRDSGAERIRTALAGVTSQMYRRGAFCQVGSEVQSEIWALAYSLMSSCAIAHPTLIHTGE